MFKVVGIDDPVLLVDTADAEYTPHRTSRYQHIIDFIESHVLPIAIRDKFVSVEIVMPNRQSAKRIQAFMGRTSPTQKKNALKHNIVDVLADNNMIVRTKVRPAGRNGDGEYYLYYTIFEGD